MSIIHDKIVKQVIHITHGSLVGQHNTCNMYNDIPFFEILFKSFYSIASYMTTSKALLVCKVI